MGTLTPAPESPRDRLFRVRDIVVASAAIVVSAPLLCLAGLAIKLDSRGPVLFRQERVGLQGRIFRIHKLRTMVVCGSGPLVSTSSDPRITRVGGLLRRTKIDELPQLFDVLVGSMSLVGPRPEVPEYVSKWPDDARETILSIRPGITDPVSVRFVNEQKLLGLVADVEKAYIESLIPVKVEGYLDYVRSRTLRGDVRIIAKTVAALFSNV